MGPSSDPGASWLKNTPYGLRKYLSHITKVLFPRVPDIVVSEFGFAEPFESQIKDVGDVVWDLRRAVRVSVYCFPFSTLITAYRTTTKLTLMRSSLPSYMIT
jgi:hypothetical protein